MLPFILMGDYLIEKGRYIVWSFEGRKTWLSLEKNRVTWTDQ